MDKILDLFNRLHHILNENQDLKTCQEFHILADELLNIVSLCHKTVLCETKDKVDFLKDADVSIPFSCGQCGDRLYWKIIDEILYIGGRGDMWNFNNLPIDYKNGEVYSPWRENDFHTVVILDGVTSIGADAFNGAEISTVIISNSVKTVREAAFFDARIEQLTLPETLETLEEGILTGFRRVVDTLIVSVNIPDIKPFALFNRDDILANSIYLTGTLPNDLTQIVESRLFDNVGSCKIYYPEEWDSSSGAFIESLSRKFTDSDAAFLKKLKTSVTPYRV